MDGVKYDEDKPNWSLVCWPFLDECVKVLTYGAKKYSPDNWKKVPDLKNRYFAACMRHLSAYREGEAMDESGFHHLAHAFCSMMFLYAAEEVEEC